MGIKYTTLINTIEKIAPPFLMEEWDNSGVQINISNKNIEIILVTLEINDEVIEEAILNKVDMIITHHPLIFKEIKQINSEEILGRYINRLIGEGISVYSSHTTFDKAIGGNNDYLISLIKLETSREVGTGDFQEFGIGRLILLKNPISLEKVAKALCNGLLIPEGEIRSVGYREKIIKKIGICTGSGVSLMEDAVKNGCDLLITGDIKYHEAQQAKALGICLLDAGHYYTERIFSPNFADKLNKLVGKKVIVLESQINLNPFGN